LILISTGIDINKYNIKYWKKKSRNRADSEKFSEEAKVHIGL